MKGVAILIVLVTHGAGRLNELLLYPLWRDQVIPLFLLIQVFHAYKKGEVHYPTFGKLWKRILRPFILIQCVFLAYYALKYFLHGIDLQDTLWYVVKCGGGGPGSYYPWIYLQVAFLCPLFCKLVRSRYAFWWFAGISIGLELFCSVVDMYEPLYRLLCFRYVFLIYLGYLWAKQGIVLNCKTVTLSIVSAAALLVLCYLHKHCPSVSFEPLVFDTDWVGFHWFTYFLAWSLLAYVLCRIYQLKPQARINQLILLFGKRSYEIFLFQMLVFGVLPLPGYVNILVSLSPVVVYEWKRIEEIFCCWR